MVGLPWNEYTKDDLSIKRAQKVLDHDHYGMEKVKDRILEHLAVLQLSGDLKSPIIACTDLLEWVKPVLERASPRP